MAKVTTRNFSTPRNGVYEDETYVGANRNTPTTYNIDSSMYDRSSVESVLSDTRFMDQFNSNPFLQYDYTPSLLDKLGNALGFGTAEDTFRTQQMMAAKQYDANLVAMMSQEKYDSPTEQVARAAAAGLNPSLDPSMVQNHPAQQDKEPQFGQDIPTNEGKAMQIVQSIGQMSQLFFGGTLSLFKQFKELGLINQNIVTQELSNSDSAMEYVIKLLANSAPNELKPEDVDDNEKMLNLIRSAKSVDLGMYSRRTAGYIRKMLGTFEKDLESGRSTLGVDALKSKLLNEFAKNQSSTAHLVGQDDTWDSSLKDMIQNVIRIFGDAQNKAIKAEYEYKFTRYSKDVAKAEASGIMAKAGFESGYYDSEFGKYRKEFEKGQMSALDVVNKQTEAVESMYAELYNYLKGRNDWAGTLGLILIPLLRSLASGVVSSAGSMLPHFSHKF